MSGFMRKAALVVGAVALVAATAGAAAPLLAPGIGGVASIAGVSAATLTAIGTYGGLAAGVLTAISTATAPGMSSQGSQTSFTTNPQSGLPYAMGRTRMSGLRIYANTNTRPGYTKFNDLLWFGAMLSIGGAIGGIEKFTADNEIVTFDASGNAIGDYHDYQAQKIHLGGQQTSALALTLGGGSAPGWTTAHKLSGITHAMWCLRYNKQGEMYGAGAPEPAWIGNWVKVYDPRLDSTYPGGSGSCRALVESTYVWSDNPGLHALTWALGRWQNGKRTCGIGAPVANIRVAEFVECANVCEANGWKVGGVEWTTDSKWDSFKRILQAGGAQPTQTGAMIGCLVSTPRTAIATIESRHLLDSLSIAATKSRRDRFNSVIPRYVDEASDWSVISGTAITVSDYVTADKGQRTKEIDYPLVQVFSGQVAKQPGQLAAYDIVNSREAGPINFTTGPEWIGLKTGDVILLNVPEEGLVNQPVLITRRAPDPSTGKVAFSAQTETYAKHAYALGQSTTPPAPFSLTAPDLKPPAPAAANWAAAGTVTGEGLPAIVVTGNSEMPSADAVLIDYKLPADASWTRSAILSANEPVQHVIAPLQSETAYQIRVGYRVEQIDGAFTILAAVTTGVGVISDISNTVGEQQDKLTQLEASAAAAAARMAQAEQDIQDLFDTYGDSASAAASAAAAANSASAAQGYANTASSASANAGAARDQAQAAQAAASASATAAANAKTDAQTAFANSSTAKDAAIAAQAAAQTARDQAQTSATNAAGSASAAAGSATTATTKATDAANSATAAAASSVSASSSAAATLPIDFTNDGEFWTNGFTSAPSSTTPIVANAQFSFVNVSGVGRVLQVIGTGANIHVGPRGWVKAIAGRLYRVASRVRALSGAAATFSTFGVALASTGGQVGQWSEQRTAMVANAWYDLPKDITGDQVLAAGSGTGAYFRPVVRLESNVTYQIAYIRQDDITESNAAGGSATAAATSASAAATSAGAAGTSATAAQNSATAANTSAGNASTSASQASTSATNAAGSASAAQSSATTAAGSATAAGNSASAASSSASTASTKATEASQSASAAAGSATTASTKAGEASTSASQAAASVTTAAGHAATAQTQATNAANSATAAGGSASAAAGSASAAQTAAGDAGNYATAAQQSSVSASLTAASMMPGDFTQDGRFWQANFNTWPENAVPIAASSTYSFPTVAGVGKLLQVATTAQRDVANIGMTALAPDRVYRVSTSVRQISGATGGAVQIYVIGPNTGGSSSGNASQSQTINALDTWYPITRTRNSNDLISAGASWVRSLVRFPSSSSSCTYQVQFIRLEDITESTAAAGSATSAASSASAASASQTAAGNSASAAQTSATNAATSAGNASTFAGNASTSATNAATSASNAAGSASTASTQATNAANSATAAGNSATAAAGSASTASTKATEAGNSATAAAASAVSASSSFTAMQQSISNQSQALPFDFSDGLAHWTRDRAGSPTAVNGAVGNITTTDGEFGLANSITNWTTVGSNILTRGVVPVAPGRVFEVRIRFRVAGISTMASFQAIAVGMDRYYASTGAGWNGTLDVTSGAPQEIVWLYSDTSGSGMSALPAGSVYARFGLRLNNSQTSMDLRVQSIRVTDVTDRIAATGSANAAASSASNASTSATNAATSASAAQASATTAQTQAGNSSSSASSASTSAANASSSATNAANSATSASSYANTAQTKAGEASASASAASSSASAASASASSAQTSATNASTYAGQAQSSATAASTSATVASDAAAAAQTSATVSAQVAAASINPNPVFAAWPTGSTYPTGYSANGTAPTISKPTGKQSPYALGTTLSSSTATSIGVRTSPVQDASVTLNSWIVLEVDAQIGSGTYQGAGVMFRIMDSSGTETVNYKVSLYSDPDIAGATGNASGVRRWRRLVQITGATPNGWQIFIFNRWSSLSGYTSSATSNYIEWSKVSFRPATDQEIASKQATADIAGLSATVTQQATTLATLTTQYASLSSTVTAQGATVSQQATAIASLQNDRNTVFAQYVLSVGVDGRVGGMKLANNGSTVGLTFRSDIVRFEDPDPGTGAMEWYDQAIRMTDGAGKLRMFMGYRA